MKIENTPFPFYANCGEVRSKNREDEPVDQMEHNQDSWMLWIE
jgi:hypothetical protein